MADCIPVRANAHVLGLFVGEEGCLAPDTYELVACINLGLVTPLGEEWAAMIPAPPVRPGCGCG